MTCVSEQAGQGYNYATVVVKAKRNMKDAPFVPLRARHDKKKPAAKCSSQRGSEKEKRDGCSVWLVRRLVGDDWQKFESPASCSAACLHLSIGAHGLLGRRKKPTGRHEQGIGRLLKHALPCWRGRAAEPTTRKKNPWAVGQLVA